MPKKAELTVTIKGDLSTDPKLNDIVPNAKNPDNRCEVAQMTHMDMKDVTTGSIVIHLCPLTDTAIGRFFSRDGRVVEEMLKELLMTARLQEVPKVETEVSVKIRQKESSSEEKGLNKFSILQFDL